MAEEIPDKLFFRIREVTEITGVKPHVLRYWESEFSRLSPRKSRSGQRVYQKKDIETVLKIKQLLYDERYTIAGARRRLAGKEKPETATIKDVSDVPSFAGSPRDGHSDLAGAGERDGSWGRPLRKAPVGVGFKPVPTLSEGKREEESLTDGQAKGLTGAGPEIVDMLKAIRQELQSLLLLLRGRP